jgi:hypothetical protein
MVSVYLVSLSAFIAVELLMTRLTHRPVDGYHLFTLAFAMAWGAFVMPLFLK